MDYDIAVIGAGPTGLSFALSLKDSGLNVVIIEKQSIQGISEPEPDGREIALTHLSHKLMMEQGSWQNLSQEAISPLTSAKVIDGDSPYTLDFDRAHDEPLGFLVSNHHIKRAIFDAFQELDNVTLMSQSTVKNVSSDAQGARLELENGDTLNVELVVAADTRFSSSRQQMGISADIHDFGRSAILATMTHEKSHHHTAVESFLYGGTLAVLPMNGNQSSIVITVDNSQADALLAMPASVFNVEVESRLKSYLGAMSLEGERYAYPLVGVHAKRFYTNRFALIGDAAVGMHPVTAHGFNLGLSGQALLAKEITRAVSENDPFWHNSVLSRYQRQHMLNTRMLYHGTNHLVGLFTDDRVPAKLLRKAVLRLSNHLPPVKWAIKQKLIAKHHPFAF